MIRTGNQYRESINDGRQVWIDGEKVKDICNHSSLKPIIDIRARMYDMAHEDNYQGKLTYLDEETNCLLYTSPSPRDPE